MKNSIKIKATILSGLLYFFLTFGSNFNAFAIPASEVPNPVATTTPTQSFLNEDWMGTSSRQMTRFNLGCSYADYSHTSFGSNLIGQIKTQGYFSVHRGVRIIEYSLWDDGHVLVMIQRFNKQKNHFENGIILLNAQLRSETSFGSDGFAPIGVGRNCKMHLLANGNILAGCNPEENNPAGNSIYAPFLFGVYNSTGTLISQMRGALALKNEDGFILLLLSSSNGFELQSYDLNGKIIQSFGKNGKNFSDLSSSGMSLNVGFGLESHDGGIKILTTRGGKFWSCGVIAQPKSLVSGVQIPDLHEVSNGFYCGDSAQTLWRIGLAPEGSYVILNKVPMQYGNEHQFDFVFFDQAGHVVRDFASQLLKGVSLCHPNALAQLNAIKLKQKNSEVTQMQLRDSYGQIGWSIRNYLGKKVWDMPLYDAAKGRSCLFRQDGSQIVESSSVPVVRTPFIFPNELASSIDLNFRPSKNRKEFQRTDFGWNSNSDLNYDIRVWGRAQKPPKNEDHLKYLYVAWADQKAGNRCYRTYVLNQSEYHEAWLSQFQVSSPLYGDKSDQKILQLYRTAFIRKEITCSQVTTQHPNFDYAKSLESPGDQGTSAFCPTGSGTDDTLEAYSRLDDLNSTPSSVIPDPRKREVEP